MLELRLLRARPQPLRGECELGAAAGRSSPSELLPGSPRLDAQGAAGAVCGGTCCEAAVLLLGANTDASLEAYWERGVGGGKCCYCRAANSMELWTGGSTHDGRRKQAKLTRALPARYSPLAHRPGWPVSVRGNGAEFATSVLVIPRAWWTICPTNIVISQNNNPPTPPSAAVLRIHGVHGFSCSETVRSSISSLYDKLAGAQACRSSWIPTRRSRSLRASSDFSISRRRS